MATQIACVGLRKVRKSKAGGLRVHPRRRALGPRSRCGDGPRRSGSRFTGASRPLGGAYLHARRRADGGLDGDRAPSLRGTWRARTGARGGRFRVAVARRAPRRTSRRRHDGASRPDPRASLALRRRVSIARAGSAPGPASPLLALALVAHRLPEGLFIGHTLLPRVGARSTAATVALLAAATVAGSVLGREAFGHLGGKVVSGVVATGVGVVLRALLHRHSSAHPTNSAALQAPPSAPARAGLG